MRYDPRLDFLLKLQIAIWSFVAVGLLVMLALVIWSAVQAL